MLSEALRLIMGPGPASKPNDIEDAFSPDEADDYDNEPEYGDGTPVFLPDPENLRGYDETK